MPAPTLDRSAIHSHPSATKALAAHRRRSASVKAMATASRIFAAAGGTRALAEVAAGVLAVEPGQMCLVSLACGGDGLRPVALGHARRTEERGLQRVLAPHLETPADAFSRAVF